MNNGRNGKIALVNGETNSENAFIETVANGKRTRADGRSDKSDIGTNGKHRKLVLHLDIRNTVLVADSVTNVSVEQALNAFITGVVWGKEEANGEWVWYSEELSLSPPAKDTITYYKHLERQLVKTPSERTRLRIETGDFTQRKIGEKFLPHFKNHLNLLEWPHRFSKDLDCLTMSGKDGKQYHYIIPSVYKCVQKLHEANRDFAIVFRTYGLDAKNVISSMSFGLEGNHPGFPKRVPLKANIFPGDVYRKDGQPIVFTVKNPDTGVTEKTFTGDREVYNMLSQSSGLSGFKDDFVHWQSNSYQHSAAKTHIIDPWDINTHHIFFDDNIRTFDDDSIVDLRLFEAKGSPEARSLSKIEGAKFEGMCMVQADLIKSIDDEDYFLDAIRKCEQNYSKFLTQWHEKH